MKTRPTKDINRAIERLRRGAPFLICRDHLHNYGGSIEQDIEAVLRAVGAPTARPRPSELRIHDGDTGE